MCSFVIGIHLAPGRQGVPRRPAGGCVVWPRFTQAPILSSVPASHTAIRLFIPVAAYWMLPATLGRWPSSCRVTPPWPVNAREVVADVCLRQDVQLTGFLPDSPCAGRGPALHSILPVTRDPSCALSACQCCWDAVVKSHACWEQWAVSLSFRVLGAEDVVRPDWWAPVVYLTWKSFQSFSLRRSQASHWVALCSWNIVTFILDFTPANGARTVRL